MKLWDFKPSANNRLYLALLLPVLGILFFASMGVIDKLNAAFDMKSVGQLTTMATQISELIHETQKERGITALFTANHGRKYQQKLLLQRQQTDNKSSQLRSFLLNFSSEQYNEQFQKDLNALLKAVEQLSSIRESVDRFDDSIKKSITRYSQINSVCLKLIASIPKLSADSQIALLSTSYTNFLKGKEVAGIERAVISGIISSGKANTQQFNRVVSLDIQQNFFFESFALSALNNSVEQYQLLSESESSQLVKQYRLQVLNKLTSTNKHISFAIDANTWFNVSSQRINALKRIEDGMTFDLKTYAQQKKNEVIQGLILYVLFVALIIVVTLFLATKLHKSKKRLGEKESELDITRNELVQSEKIASLGRMVAGFAHEVNTPIGIAVGAISQIQQSLDNFNSLIQQDEVEEEDILDNLNVMNRVSKLDHSNLNRAAQLVRSFKRTSIDQASEQQRRYNVKNAIDDVLFTLGSKLSRANVAVSVQCRENIDAFGQPGRFDQLITNLVLNSLVHGFVNCTHKGKITLAIELSDELIHLSYQDNGIGMDEATLDKIFEPFFTTNRSDGSGLGMYLCHSIVVNDMNGHIRCSSSPQQGVHFEIVFPCEGS